MTPVDFLGILLGCVVVCGLVVALWLWREGER